MSEFTELPDGIVDLYVHALPDLIERSEDDIEVSRRLQAAGFRAAVHRHHFQSTTAQSRLAREVTGFPLYGAIVCNSNPGQPARPRLSRAPAVGIDSPSPLR